MRSFFAVFVVAFAVAAGVAPAIAAEGVIISGTVFDDTDRNSVLGPGEPGHASVTVTVVSVPAGLLDTSTTTDGNGTYSFIVASGATYRVRIVVPSGTVQNSANPADFSADLSVTTINFALVPPPETLAVPATSPATLLGIALLVAGVGFRLFRSS